MATAFEIRRPPEAFSLSPVGKGKRKPREKDEGYLRWIRTLPCVITGKQGVEACHIRFADPRFAKFETPMGQKPHDKWTLPMIGDYHRQQHSMSERLFWARIGIDPCQVASALYGCGQNDDEAAIILAQARANASTMSVPRSGE